MREKEAEKRGKMRERRTLERGIGEMSEGKTEEENGGEMREWES